MVTASHNPMDYNGMKFVREESRPISGDSGLERDGTDHRRFPSSSSATGGGTIESLDLNDRIHVDHLLSYIDTSRTSKSSPWS